MTVSELATKIGRIEGVAPNRGATLHEIRTAELRLGQALPSEFRELVAVMDGCNGATPPNQSWVRFWSLREWRSVGKSGSTDLYAQAIIFADYCDESWWYAFESTGPNGVRILKIDGPDCVVGESLTEFFEAVLVDDSKIYGTQAGPPPAPPPSSSRRT